MYCSSKTVLADHADAGFHNKSKERIQEGAHIFLSDNHPEPMCIEPLLTIAQNIRFVMTSAAQAELGALLITSKEMIPLQQILSEMGWPQSPSPVQTDKSIDEGIVNNTIVPQKIKSTGL